MSKTAMQEFKAFLEQQAGIGVSEDYRLALEDAVSWCDRHYLDKEKEQLRHAFLCGDNAVFHYPKDYTEDFKSFVEYYDKIFNQLKQ